jgi:hypothetical protein
MSDWKLWCDSYWPTGSRYICTPPTMDTDEDFVVLMDRGYHAKLDEIGFAVEGRPGFYTGNDNGGFLSFRRGDENLIATDDPEFFNLFVTATELAKRFNLTEKADRIALFQAVLYGVEAENLERTT